MCFLAGCLTLSASCEYSERRAKLRFSTNRRPVTFSKFQNRLRNNNALQCCFLSKSVDLCCGLRIRFTHELRSCNFLRTGKKHPVQSRGRRRNARQLVGQKAQLAECIQFLEFTLISFPQQILLSTSFLLWLRKVSSRITFCKHHWKRWLGGISDSVLGIPGGSLSLLEVFSKHFGGT